MSAYMIVDITHVDEQRMAEYRAGAVPIVLAHGGRLLVDEQEPAPLEGGWQPNRVIVIEFPDRAAIRAYLDAAEYQPWKALRQANSLGRSVAVDAVGSPA